MRQLHSERINHLSPCVIKQFPLSVKRKLSKLSTDRKIFIKVIRVDQEALKQAAYSYKLSYNNNDKDNTNNNNNQDSFNIKNNKNIDYDK